MMKSLITAAVSLSLIASPAVTWAAPAPSQAGTAVPASEHVEGQQALAGTTLLLIGGAVLAILVLVLVLGGSDDDDLPASP